MVRVTILGVVCSGLLLGGCGLFPSAHWQDDVGRRCVDDCNRRRDEQLSNCTRDNIACTTGANGKAQECWKECPGVTVK